MRHLGIHCQGAGKPCLDSYALNRMQTPRNPKPLNDWQPATHLHKHHQFTHQLNNKSLTVCLREVRFYISTLAGLISYSTRVLAGAIITRQHQQVSESVEAWVVYLTVEKHVHNRLFHIMPWLITQGLSCVFDLWAASSFHHFHQPSVSQLLGVDQSCDHLIFRWLLSDFRRHPGHTEKTRGVSGNTMQTLAFRYDCVQNGLLWHVTVAVNIFNHSLHSFWMSRSQSHSGNSWWPILLADLLAPYWFVLPSKCHVEPDDWVVNHEPGWRLDAHSTVIWEHRTQHHAWHSAN
jgi:hypothetical protein